MLSQLQGDLYQEPAPTETASTATTPPVTTTTTSAAAAATGLAPTSMAPVAAATGYQETPEEKAAREAFEKRVGDANKEQKVEVPVEKPPAYDTDNPPPASAPNGSTYTNKRTGVVYTKRGGVWGVVATDAANGGMPTGYNALNDAVTGGQFGGGLSGSGVNTFLQQFGIPKNEAEWAALAASTQGMSVAQLKAMVAANPMMYDTQANLIKNAEQSQWMAQSRVSRIPEGYLYVSASEGGPGIRRMTFDERARSLGGEQYVYGGRALYENPSNAALVERNQLTPEERSFLVGGASGGGSNVVNQGGGGITDIGGGGSNIVDQGGGGGTNTIGGAGAGPGGPGEGRPLLDEPDVYYPDRNPPSMGGGPRTGGGTPATTGDGTTGGGTTGGGTTSGGGTTGGGGGAVGGGGYGGVTGGADYTTGAAQFALSAQAQQLRDALQARLAELGAGPSKLQGQSYEALRAARQAELGAKYGAERSKLEEELAARGLAASTIGGGRYGDLAGQQARALSTLEAELLGQQAEAEARDRALYLNTMQQFAQTAGQQDIGTFEANVKSRQATADINLRAKELQQRAALEGQSLALQAARDQATAEYQRGQLQLGKDEFGESKRKNLVLEGVQNNDLSLRQGTAVSNLISDIYGGRVPVEAWESVLRGLGLDPAKYTGFKPSLSTKTDPNKDKAPDDKGGSGDKGGSDSSGGPGGSTGRPTRPGAYDGEVVNGYRWNAGDYSWEKYTGF
jgi:hypothetical protein